MGFFKWLKSKTVTEERKTDEKNMVERICGLSDLSKKFL